MNTDDEFDDSDPFAEEEISTSAESSAQEKSSAPAMLSTQDPPAPSTASASAAFQAEILESSTQSFVAQCRDLHCAPPFGSFVRAPEDDRREIIFGVVSRIATEPLDASRRPLALWTHEDEMPQRHPQIGKLLRTVFEAKSIGWGKDGTMRRSLPHQPPRLHTFVLPCSTTDVRTLTEEPSWVRLLLENNSENDELLVAACRQAIEAHGDDFQYKVRLGRELSKPLRADYYRLRDLLARIES